MHIFTCSSSPSRLIYCIFHEKHNFHDKIDQRSLQIKVGWRRFSTGIRRLLHETAIWFPPPGSWHSFKEHAIHSFHHLVTRQGSFNEPGSHHPVSATWFPPPGLYQLNPQFTYSPTTAFPIYYINRAI